MELNPILYKAARQKDLDYAIKCKKAKAPACLGPMHGIPVILKDNVAANYMQNTAGRGDTWQFVQKWQKLSTLLPRPASFWFRHRVLC